MPTTDLEENKIKQAQPEEGNNTSQNERDSQIEGEYDLNDT